MHTKSVVAIIPARYGSSRFPGKPLAKILGKTLIRHTYENTKRCPLIQKVIVATDDQRICDHVLDFGGEVVMTPQSCPTGSDRLGYVLEIYPELQNAEIIVNVQGDDPCINPDVIEAMIKALRQDEETPMSTAAVKIKSQEDFFDPSIVKCVFDLNGNALYFSRSFIPYNFKPSPSSELSCYKHLGIYAYRPKFLLKYIALPMTPLQQLEDLEQLKVIENGYVIKITIVTQDSPGVNTPEDIKKVEQELCKQSLFSLQAESVPL